MKTIIGMLTASFLGVVSVASAFADPSAAIRNSQRIVVVTDSEGIHYAKAAHSMKCETSWLTVQEALPSWSR